MRLFVILTLFLFSMAFVSSICEEGQIDINSASAEELDKITHVGPAIAQRIIDNRPFDSIDGLEKVSGISIGYVEDIKSQNLACVADEDSGEEELVDKENISEETAIKEAIPKDIELQPIELKTEENSQLSETKNKESLAFYGLFAFVILLGLLFLIRHTRKGKNELV